MNSKSTDNLIRDIRQMRPSGPLDLDAEKTAQFMNITTAFSDQSLERCFSVLMAEFRCRGASWDYLRTRVNETERIDDFTVEQGFPEMPIDNDRWDSGAVIKAMNENLGNPANLPEDIKGLINHVKDLINDPAKLDQLRAEIEADREDETPGLMEAFGRVLADAIRDSGLPIEVEGNVGNHGVVLSINSKEAREWMDKQHTTRYAGTTKH